MGRVSRRRSGSLFTQFESNGNDPRRQEWPHIGHRYQKRQRYRTHHCLSEQQGDYRHADTYGQ